MFEMQDIKSEMKDMNFRLGQVESTMSTKDECLEVWEFAMELERRLDL